MALPARVGARPPPRALYSCTAARAGCRRLSARERSLASGTWHEAPLGGKPLVPIEPARVGKVLALGKNFREHAAEFGEAVPEEPLYFNKLPETLVPDGATLRVPALSREAATEANGSAARSSSIADWHAFKTIAGMRCS